MYWINFNLKYFLTVLMGNQVKITKLVFMILLNFVLMTEQSSAKVYKWVDENGSVHFTDKEPVDSNVKIEELKVKTNSFRSNLKLPDVKPVAAISNEIGAKSKTVVLEYASLELDISDKSTVVGKAFKFTKKGEKIASDLHRGIKQRSNPLTCLDDGDLNLSDANYIKSLVNFTEPFQSEFKRNNYNVISQDDNRFSMQKKASSDLSIGATIKKIKLAHCGKSTSANLKVYSQNSSYIKVHWEVFDNLSRKVIYVTQTEGLDTSLRSSPKMNGAATSFGLAFQQSVAGLLSQQDFVDILTNNRNNTTVSDTSTEKNKVFKNIDLSYGNSSTDFSNQIDKIKQASATIRTTSGHGSGFVISHSGYVLTNDHVVNQNNQVLVIIQGKVHNATLIKSDPLRDVALLKIEGDFIGRAVKISSDAANLGEKIFVIGTPLDESLDFTITSGIISANRDLKGKSYYQTDAAVNPGNSGGPVFDDHGNVIGMTVSGHFTKDGGSRNINYLIPISSALSSLGIKP